MKYYQIVSKDKTYFVRSKKIYRNKKEVEKDFNIECDKVIIINLFMYCLYKLICTWREMNKKEKVLFIVSIIILIYITVSYIDVISNNLNSGELANWNLLKIFKK